MSRNYSTIMRIEGLNEDDKSGDIEDALDTLGYGFDYEFDSYKNRDGEKIISCYAHGDNTLGGGYSEEAASRDIREAVWKVVGRFVNVSVGWIYLEEPNMYHEGSEDDAKAFLASLPKCERCGKLCDENEELCDACDMDRPEAETHWCASCKAWIEDARDPDETHCLDCKIVAAEYACEGDR